MAAGDYPIPSTAAYIWTSGDRLFLGLPGEAGLGHTVVIPLDKMIPDVGMTGLPKPYHRGFAVLLATLREREMGHSRPQIGERGALPKHAIAAAVESDEKYQAWQEAMGAKKIENAAEKAEASAFLEGLGL